MWIYVAWGGGAKINGICPGPWNVHCGHVEYLVFQTISNNEGLRFGRLAF
jgi:hypothetical protein